MTASNPSAAPSTNLAIGAKVYIALGFLLSTIATAFITSGVTNHYEEIRVERAAKQSEVAALQQQIGTTDDTIGIYAIAIRKGPAVKEQEAVLAELRKQRQIVATLTARLPIAEQPLARRYRARLAEMAINIRRAHNFPTAEPFVQSLSRSVDEREAMLNALRATADLPVESKIADR